MLKRLASIIVALSVAFTTGLAYESESAVKTDSKRVFTLQEAIEYALEHNKELRDAEEDIKKAKVALDSAQESRRAEEKSDFRMKGYEGDRLLGGYYEKQAEQGIELLTKQKEQKKESLKYDLEKLFYDIKTTKDKAEYIRESIKRMEQQIAIEELKINLNMSTQLVLDTVKLQKDALVNQLSNLEYALAGYYTALKTKLGIDPLAEVEITPVSTTYAEYVPKDIEEAYKSALENNISILAAKQRVELLELDLEIVKKYYTLGFKTYRDNEIDLRKARDDYDILQKTTRDQLKLLFDDIAIKKSEYLNKKEALAKAEFNYKIAQLKFLLGLISRISLMDEHLSLMNSRIEEETALQKYILSARMYELSYAHGVHGDGSPAHILQ